MPRTGTFPARFASSCLCGAWVTSGMRIAFCSEMRRVTMCPCCAPSATAKKATIGNRYPVFGGRMTVASLRIDGKVVALSFRHASADSFRDWARYSVRDGEWTCTGSSLSIDAPVGLTHANVLRAIEEASAQVKAAA